MASKIKKKGWVLIIVIALIVDVLQIVLDIALQVGVVVNRFLDIGFGVILAGYFQMNGVSMTNPKRLLGMIATFLGEEIPDVDVLPFWTADVLYTYSTVKIEEKLNKKRTEEEMWLNQATATANTLYKDGVRQPEQTQTNNSGQTTVMNRDGVRRPDNRNPNFQINASAGTTTGTGIASGATKGLASVKV